MIAKVDQDLCIGCGLCPSICPSVYEMQDDGKAHAIVDSVPDSDRDDAKEGADNCPVSAISVEE